MGMELDKEVLKFESSKVGVDMDFSHRGTEVTEES